MPCRGGGGGGGGSLRAPASVTPAGPQLVGEQLVGRRSSSLVGRAAAPTPRRPRPTPSAATRAPGTGTGDRYYGGRNNYYYGSPYYYGRRYYYDAFDPFYYGAYGYSPFYYSGYYGYAPYYYRGRYRDGGSLRVIVEPEKTRVYVDGYYAGIADDFDGIFQRLYLPPGRHEISLKLDGYRTHKFSVYVPVDQTIKIHHDMERGTGEDDGRGDRRARELSRATTTAIGDDRDDGRDEPRYEGAATATRTTERGRAGRRGGGHAAPRRQARRRLGVRRRRVPRHRAAASRTCACAPGRHRVEVVRPGYRTVEREIDVRPGDEQTERGDRARSRYAARRLLAPAADGERRGGGLVEVLVDAAGHGRGDVAAARPHEHHHHDLGAVGRRVGREPAHARAGARLARPRSRRGRTRWRRCLR